jgi:site-specific DNA-methyltransferase (adenine-specific)
MREPYYKDDAVTIFHGDCREIVPDLGKFDLLLTDPPYGIGYSVKPQVVGYGNRRILMGGKPPIVGDDVPFDPSFMMESSRWIITFGANYYSDKLPVSGAWFVWDKTGGGRGPDNNFADVEMAWTNTGKQPKLFAHLWKGLVRGSEAGNKVIHATQKPLELMLWCIREVDAAAKSPVQTILDPFAGSGTTGRAAKDLGRKAVLIEIEERYCEIAANRMRQEVLL